MLTEKFVCTNCGHRFESQTAEALVCPRCFWQTSVQKVEGNPGTAAPAAPREEAPVPPQERPRLLWLAGGTATLILVLVGIGFFAARHLQDQEKILQPEPASVPAPEVVSGPPVAPEAPVPLTDSEKEILERRVPLRTPKVQGLATPPWDEKQFDAFLKSQEAQYQLPFEWSYRRKLVRLFKAHYLTAAAAFDAKNLLKARDEWIRSLTFPVYQGDIQKHRGVALTMLRPYVNDTLSRIGIMNAKLTEGEIYATEEKIRSSYETLLDLLKKESWEEAGAKILELQKDLEEATQAWKPVVPPPLPQEVSLIDADIQAVLSAQVAPTEPAIRDWQLLQEDLTAKEKVVQSRSVP